MKAAENRLYFISVVRFSEFIVRKSRIFSFHFLECFGVTQDKKKIIFLIQCLHLKNIYCSDMGTFQFIVPVSKIHGLNRTLNLLHHYMFSIVVYHIFIGYI